MAKERYARCKNPGVDIPLNACLHVRGCLRLCGWVHAQLCLRVFCVSVFYAWLFLSFLRLFTDMFAEEKGDWKTQMKNTKKKLTLFSSKRNCGEETRHLTPEC